MSGRKQHFIPQSLLRGFGVKRGKSTYVVAYTHDHGIFTSATDGIAAEHHFYSELAVEGDETLDDRITKHESPLAMLLARLRALNDGDCVDPQEAAAFVTHLVVRNDHFRKAVSSASGRMVDQLSAQLEDGTSASALIGLAGDHPQGLFAEQLKVAFDTYQPQINMLGMDRATFERWAFDAAKADFDTMHNQSIRPLSKAVAAMVDILSETAANAQRKVLIDDLAPATRLEAYAELTWHVIYPRLPLILPDCVAIGLASNGDCLPLMIIDREHLSTVIMPIAYDRLLVGMGDGSVQIPDGLNSIMAGCSWDFFVARHRTQDLEELRGSLRSLIEPHIDGIVDGVVADGLAIPKT